jgi:ABC-type antimicrobial peptide transport system permease subunit
MALGASQRNVFGLILGHGLRPLATGAVAGLAGSWALTRYLAEMLYGVGATDPLTFIGAPLLLVMTGMAACAIAGMRAARIDPAVALRHE